MTRMNNFFCALHYLVGLAESTDKTISMWEFSLLSDNSTQTLVCTACKAFKMSSWIACDVMKEKSCSKQLDLLLDLLRHLRQGGKRQNLDKRIEDNVRKELNTIKEKEGLTKKIQESGGLWTKEEELENGLPCCQHKEEERGS